MDKYARNNVIGERGESFAYLALTNYVNGSPLFNPCFLGAKHSAIDFYVELCNVEGLTPYFFAQIKATSKALTSAGKLEITSANAGAIAKLLQYPAPTYILGIHEPSGRVYIRAVCSTTPEKAITTIPSEYELTNANLLHLQQEVLEFWQFPPFVQLPPCKPYHSYFS